MGKFIDEHGPVQHRQGQRFSLSGAACEIKGCTGLRAGFGDITEARAP